MPNVSHIRPEVAKAMDSWTLLSDCLAGQEAIKSKRTIYLPQPNASDTSQENTDRYNAYLTRAVFYNVTARTLRGLLGQVFSRESILEIPDQLKILEEDPEGTGVELEQQAKSALANVLTYGRAGLLADFPVTGEAVTRAQVDSGVIRPLLKLYRPQDIINWRTSLYGAKTKLSLVVLREWYDSEDDGYEVLHQEQYRVLRLNEAGNYTVTVYRAIEGANKTKEYVPYGEELVPTDYAGRPFNEILFSFIGAETNSAEVDASPLLDMAVLNIAHYRNSADYEDSCFMVGQPTPWASGLSQNWVKDVLKDTIHLGSRAFLPLPVNAAAGLLQAQENSMVFEAMQHKERQMVALGAKLVEQASVQRTATEASQEEAAESSALSSAVKNVSTAYTNVLRYAGRFVGEFAPEAIEYELNSDFDLSSMTSDERRQLIAEWQADAISFTEMRWNLKRGGVAYLDDEEAKDEIATNPAIQIDTSTPTDVNTVDTTA